MSILSRKKRPLSQALFALLGELFDKSAFFKQNFDVGAFNFLHNDFEQFFFLEGELNFGYGLLINGVVAGAEQFADIIFAAPNLRHAAVNVKQRIDGFHTGTHGIFGGENGIAGSFCELTDECEVHCAVGNDLRAVGVLSGLEECVDIRHKAGCGVAGILCKVGDFILRHAYMIELLAANLFAGAVAHGFLDIVALFVGVKGVQPHKNHILILRFELGLTVDSP